MAVTPHAQSYIDLRDRVEVAYAYSPSVERRRAFAAGTTSLSGTSLNVDYHDGRDLKPWIPAYDMRE